MTKLSVNINKVATLRNARGGNLPDVERFAVDCELFGAQGITVHPRPDERHLAGEDVEELGDLVERGLAEKPSERRHACVVCELEVGVELGLERRICRQEGVEPLVGIGIHRPELPHADRTAVFPEAICTVEHRPPARQLDQDGNDHEERPETEKSDE